MATTEPASILHPDVIRALMNGDASRNERLHFLRTVADLCDWRAGECESLDLWGDSLESEATATAIRAVTDPQPDPAQLPAFSMPDYANALLRGPLPAISIAR